MSDRRQPVPLVQTPAMQYRIEDHGDRLTLEVNNVLGPWKVEITRKGEVWIDGELARSEGKSHED